MTVIRNFDLSKLAPMQLYEIVRTLRQGFVDAQATLYDVRVADGFNPLNDKDSKIIGEYMQKVSRWGQPDGPKEIVLNPDALPLTVRRFVIRLVHLRTQELSKRIGSDLEQYWHYVPDSSAAKTEMLQWHDAIKILDRDLWNYLGNNLC